MYSTDENSHLDSAGSGGTLVGLTGDIGTFEEQYSPTTM